MKRVYYSFITLVVFSSLLLLFTVLSGCEKNPTKDSNGGDGNGRIIINNDSAELDSRVTYKSEEIDVDDLLAAEKIVAIGKKRKGTVIPVTLDTMYITLVSEVNPPEYQGITLQATDIYIKGGYAYVSYNVAGPTFLGGVDIFDISEVSYPRLISNALFTDTDVNGISIDGNNLYLASANESYGFGNYAMLESIKLNKGLLSSESTIVDISSWAATDVDITKDNVFVTSGAADGYINILEKQSLAKLDSIAVEDARGVSVDKSLDNAVVVAGTPARLLVFQGSTSPTVYNLDGATIPFSKSTVELHGDNALLALSDGGTQIVNVLTGNVIKTIPQPEVAGLSLDVTVTNAATVSGNILFMACGEAGIYTASISSKTKFKLDDVVDGNDIKLLGKFQFGDGQSANHVTFSKETLFVASGLGGLKILEISLVPPSEPPSITVISPDGGENWTAGTAYDITWNYTTIDQVDIKYSTNGGDDWIKIKDRVKASDGAYSWTVPDTPSANCLVKIWDRSDHNVTDQSDGVFTIN